MKLSKVLWLAVAVAGLVACASLMTETREGETITGVECAARGGQITGVVQQACALPASDAGKGCSKAGDCQGICQAETRTCSSMDIVLGCFSFLDENGQVLSICAD